MLSLSAKIQALCAAALAGCRRLVDSAGLTTAQAELRLRLTGVLMAAPLVAASATALVFSFVTGPAVIVVAICTVFCICWLAGLTVASHGREKPLGLLMLVAATILAVALTAAGGGLASPVALLLCALAFEPWWVFRTRRAAIAGFVAAGSAAVMTGILGQVLFGPAEAAATLWIPTLLYLGTIAGRLSYHERNQETAQLNLAQAIDAVVLRLADNGDVTDVTAKAHEVLRLPPEMLLQQGLFERIHVADRVAYLCAISDLRNGAANRQMDIRLRLPQPEADELDGGYDWLSMELVPISPETGEVAAILRQNPKFGELTARLAASEERAQKAEIAKSSFLASVSHELRTPLNAIIGFSDMLVHELYGSFSDPRQKEQVTLISDAGHHLLSVVNSILDVSKIELDAYEILPEPFEFAETVQACRNMMSLQAQAKSIVIETDVDAKVGEINADRRAIRQILINLLSNAVKFTPEGGKITIGALRRADAVDFWVSDTGIGIAQEDMARLGQPFVQVQTDYARNFEGTGLGLALVKGLVRLHRGSLSVESEVGRGTTVRISLPSSAAPDAGHPRMTGMQMFKDGNADGAFRKTA